MMFHFKFKLNDEDYLLFNQYHLLNSDTGKKSLTTFRLIAPILGLFVVIIFFIAGSEPGLIVVEAIFMAALSILWVVLSKTIMFRSLKKHIKKLKAKGRLPYSNEVEIQFNDENIHEITPNTENKTAYVLVEKIGLTENAIYIYFSAVQAYIVPLSVFKDEEEKHNFLNYIHLKTNI